MLKAFNILFIIIPILAGLIFIFTILIFFSPKIRAKIMGTQIKATKYMLDDNKDNLSSIASTTGDIFVNSTTNIIDKNEEKLKNIVDKTANISKDGITTTVKAIKDGILDQMYCKYCGSSIDKDSLFCKSCGKKQ